jgi:perosamine synthetase
LLKYPVYRPSLTGNERRYVDECIDSTWISSRGPFISRFESCFGAYTGSQYAASVSNGTVAIHLALLALGIGPGAEVIVPTLTYIASVNAIAYTGATPVFCDSLADSWQMDPKDVRRNITPRTRAILAVHLYGQPCEMDALQQIAGENNLFLVEDCAEAFGSLYKGRHVGTLGDIGTFSFFGSKTITTGEGGMVVTGDQGLHHRMVRLKGQGLSGDREYWHDMVGYNYRMTNICAAIGLAQLEQADRLIARKRRIAEWYQRSLAGVPVTVHQQTGDVRHSYWMVSILVPDPSQKDPLRAALLAQGIETRPVFYPVHTMPMYSFPQRCFAVAEGLSGRGISLPSYPGLEEDSVEEICAAIRAFFGHSSTCPRTASPSATPQERWPARGTPNSHSEDR